MIIVINNLIFIPELEKSIYGQKNPKKVTRLANEEGIALERIH